MAARGFVNTQQKNDYNSIFLVGKMDLAQQNGATTLGKTTLGKMTFGIMKHSITTLNITPFIITTLSITIKICDNQRYGTLC
jgi:hypothetical protein